MSIIPDRVGGSRLQDDAEMPAPEGGNPETAVSRRSGSPLHSRLSRRPAIP